MGLPESLQWGRTFSSADKCQRRKRSKSLSKSFNGAALFQVRITKRRLFVGVVSFGFNGAALFQVRITQTSQTRRQNIFCFNGAALFQVRIKDVKTPCRFGNNSMLQWGRTFSSADNFLSHSSLTTGLVCFNGAALFQVRISGWHSALALRLGMASMGPHFFKCG